MITGSSQALLEEDIEPGGVVFIGAVWDDRKANIRLAGSLGSRPAMPLFVMAQVGEYAPVRLAFAWVKSNGE